MKRKKIFLVTLIVVLALIFVALWALFAVGRFNLIADLILQPTVEMKKSFAAADVFNNSYFEGLKLENGKISVAQTNTLPTLSDVSSSIEVKNKAVISGNEAAIAIGWWGEERVMRRNTHIVYFEVYNNSSQDIAPLEIKIPNIVSIPEQSLEIYSLFYPQVGPQDGFRSIYIDKIAPKETKKVALITLGMEDASINQNLLGGLKFFGKTQISSLTEEYTTLNCETNLSDCNLVLNYKGAYWLGKYTTTYSAADLAAIKNALNLEADTIYLGQIFVRPNNLGEDVLEGELGFKIEGANFVPLSGRVENGIWYVPIKNMFSGKSIKYISQFNGWFLADKKITNDNLKLVQLRKAKLPKSSLVFDVQKMDKLTIANPAPGGGQAGFALPQGLKICALQVPDTTLESTWNGFFFNQVLVTLGDPLNKYQAFLFVPYLSGGTNSSRNAKIMNAEDWARFDSDEAGDAFFYLHSFNAKGLVTAVQRLYTLSTPDADFYKGDYAFYGLEDYRGTLWGTINLNQPKNNYEMSFSWSKPNNEVGNVGIQVRTEVGGNYTPWVSLDKDVSNVKIVAGTDKVQYRLVFESSDPAMVRSLTAINLIRSGTTAGDNTNPTIGTNGSTTFANGLISTGTHLLLLLVISIILVVSIIYIVALLKED